MPAILVRQSQAAGLVGACVGDQQPARLNSVRNKVGSRNPPPRDPHHHNPARPAPSRTLGNRRPPFKSA